MAYLPHSHRDVADMLEKIGVSRFDELLASIPEVIRQNGAMDLPEPLSELELREELKRHVANIRNTDNSVSFLGGGAYDHYIPAVVDFILSRPEFATAYTPYQAEVSQGTLQVMYEFQSLVCELTGMEAANASMYDAATAMVEAAVMARNITRKSHILISEAVNPLYRQVLETYAHAQGMTLVDLPLSGLQTDTEKISELITDETAAVIVQSPNFFGVIEDTETAASFCHNTKSLFIQGVDPISLALLKTPGDVDADIVFGEGQALGNHLNYGGPYLGLFAVKKKYVRKMPGRISGMTEDADGKRGFVLTLQTREQHIRREKASSNICSNQALCVVAATVYLALMGKTGLKQVAELSCRKAHYLYEGICSIPGFSASDDSPFFKEFVVNTPVPAAQIVKDASQENIFPGVDLGRFDADRKNQLLIAVTEKRSREQLDELIIFLKKYSK